jgi:hypothetical protein
MTFDDAQPETYTLGLAGQRSTLPGHAPSREDEADTPDGDWKG